MEPLTEKQLKVLRFIEKRLKDGRPPSQKEVAEHFSLVQNAAYQLISYLRNKGYLVNLDGHRGLRLSKEYLEKKKQADGIPIVGRVAAGSAQRDTRCCAKRPHAHAAAAPRAGPAGAFDDATKAQARETLFNNIAPVYDELNDRLSFGRHWGWKRDAVRRSGAAPRTPRHDGKNDVAGRFSRRARAGRVLPGLLVTVLSVRAAGPAVTS